MAFKKKQEGVVREYYDAGLVDIFLTDDIRVTKQLVEMYERQVLRNPDSVSSSSNLADCKARLAALTEFQNRLERLGKEKIRIKY